MLALIPLVLVVAAVCGGFFYWLSQHGLAVPAAQRRQVRRRISLLTEAVAYIGAILVLSGGGVAVGQSWHDITDWGHVGIFASTALFFLAVGLVVLFVTEQAIQRMIGVVWLVSAACAGAAAGIAAHDIYGWAGAATAAAVGLVAAVYSGILWLVRKGELQLVGTFAGLAVAVSAGIVSRVTTFDPWLAAALGMWALGIGWVIVGWKYPQPLWTTVPLAVAFALIGPALAVWSHGWMFGVAIATAAAAMIASVVARKTLLLGAGTLALFGYVSAVVVRYFHASLGLPPTLAICGVLLLALALVMARVRRETSLAAGRAVPARSERVQLPSSGTGRASAGAPRALPSAQAPAPPAAKNAPDSHQDAEHEPPTAHLPRAS